MANDLLFPRTVDGEVSLECDNVTTAILNVTDTAHIENLFVYGLTSLPGGTVTLFDITANSLTVATTTGLNSLTVSGLSALAAMTATSIGATGVVTGGSFVTLGSVTAASVTASGNVGGGTVSSTGILTAGSISTGAIGCTSLVSTGSVSGSGLTTAGLMFSGSVNTGAVSASSVTATGIVSGGSLSTAGTMTSASVSAGTASFNGGVASTTFTTGTVVITGGLGVSGNIWIDNGSIAGGVNSSISAGVLNSQFIVANGLNNSTSPSTGALRVDSGGLGVGLDAYVGGHVTSANGDNATSATTGAIIAPNGGIGCSRDIWGGARVIANSPANATSILTGAINAPYGGIGVGQDVWAGGKITGANFVIPQITGYPFSYSTGSWTPVFTSIAGPAAALTVQPWSSPTVNYATGNYTKIGNLVTLYYDLSYTLPGAGNDYVSLIRWFAIGGAPFESNVASSVGAGYEDSFPDGFALFAPVPLAVAITHPVRPMLAVTGDIVYPQNPPLFANTTAGFSSDGFTFLFNGPQFWDTLVYTIEGDGTANNFNILAVGGPYTVKLKGQITYLSN